MFRQMMRNDSADSLTMSDLVTSRDWLPPEVVFTGYHAYFTKKLWVGEVIDQAAECNHTQNGEVWYTYLFRDDCPSFTCTILYLRDH